MATYLFVCDNCGAKDSIEQSMSKITPKTILCTECGANMRRDICGENKTTTIIIPDHMTAVEVNKPQYTFDKSPSKKKHYF